MGPVIVVGTSPTAELPVPAPRTALPRHSSARSRRDENTALGAIALAILLLASTGMRPEAAAPFTAPPSVVRELSSIAPALPSHPADRPARAAVAPRVIHPAADTVAFVGGPTGGASLSSALSALSRGLGPARGQPMTCRPDSALTGVCLRGLLPGAVSLSERWQNASPWLGRVGLPPAAYGGAMAYDAADGEVVYFGGSVGGVPSADTWIWHGGQWVNATDPRAPTPPASVWPSMAYDATYQVVLLYGGCAPGGCPLNDTWYFTQASGWTNLTPLLSPRSPALFGASMAFAADPYDGYTVLTGGCVDANCSLLSNQTLGFAGSGWVPIPSPSAPPPVWGASLAYDPTLGALVRFGGCRDVSCTGAETWSYLNYNWTNETAAFGAGPAGPPGRGQAVLTWDELDGTLVLEGGDSNGQVRNDTWSLDCRGVNCAWTACGAASYGLPPLAGSAAPSTSNASMGTILFGGASRWTAGAPSMGAGPDSNGTFVLDPMVTSDPVLPPSAPARSNVFAQSNPSGGSGTYLRFAGIYNATWWVGTASFMGVNATLTFPFPGPYLVHVTVVDRFGVSASASVSYVATGPTSSIQGGLLTYVDMPLNLSATPATGGNAPYSYRWTFGDGLSAQGISVNHTWTSAGSYNVTLHVVDALGVVADTSVTVVVRLGVTAVIVADRTRVDVGQAVALAPAVSGAAGPYSYTWDFGDGTPTTALASPSHTYYAIGTYVVSLLAVDSLGDRGSATASISVAPALTGSVNATPSETVTGAVVTFSARPVGGTSPYSVDWVFGDGATSNLTPSTHRYAAPGNYTVVAWINDTAGVSLERRLTVSVAPAPPPPPAPTSGIPLEYLALGGLLVLAGVAAGILLLRRRRPPDGNEGPALGTSDRDSMAPDTASDREDAGEPEGWRLSSGTSPGLAGPSPGSRG